MKKIIYLIGEDKAFLTHRLNLANAAKKAGLEVHLVTHFTRYEREIQDLGFYTHPLNHFHRGGMNPFKDCLALFEIIRIYRKIKPDFVHQIAWKPVFYGSIAACFAPIPKVINALTGLGYLFISSSLKAKALRGVLKIVFPRVLRFLNQVIIAQNPDDQNIAQNYFKIDPKKIILIRGSGVDTQRFKPAQSFPKGRLHFICVARMLWDKGMQELAEATRIAKLTHANFDVILCGDTDEANPAAIPADKIKEWVKQGLVHWKGHVEDVAQVYAAGHVAILPSYREGLPKSLLEAAACGLPIITTDAPGCKEIVIDNYNGFLVPVKDARALANAMRRMIDNPALRLEFGKNSRQMVLSHFSDEIIIAKMLELYNLRQELFP